MKQPSHFQRGPCPTLFQEQRGHQVKSTLLSFEINHLTDYHVCCGLVKLQLSEGSKATGLNVWSVPSQKKPVLESGSTFRNKSPSTAQLCVTLRGQSRNTSVSGGL